MVERLLVFDVKFFCTDHWEAYAKLIPKEKLIQTKAKTHGIKRNNSRQRHWCGRFRRKTCIISRSIQMVELTVALFARFIVNGKRELIMPLILLLHI